MQMNSGLEKQAQMKGSNFRHFYRYEPPRELAEIEAEIKNLEGEILELLREVTA